jgi:hypothetical protein
VFPLVVDVEVGVEVEVEKELIPVGAFMKELAVTNIAMCAMLSVAGALALKNYFTTVYNLSKFFQRIKSPILTLRLLNLNGRQLYTVAVQREFLT